LLTPAWRRLWKTITAFTAAHSLTLALAATDIVRLPPAPVEATIALTIVFVAREVWLVQHGLPGSTASRDRRARVLLVHRPRRAVLGLRNPRYARRA
jgi:hypothetical protein